MRQLLFAIFMALAGVSGFAQSGTCGENLTWVLENGTLTIRGSGAMTDYDMRSDTYAPWYSEYRSWIQSVVVEPGVEHIGAWSFYSCGQLKSITLPERINSIGDGTFSYCNSLNSISIPTSVTAIGNYVFFGCLSLESVTIPEGVTSIGFQSFTSCSGLTSIHLPRSVGSMAMYAFAGCDHLTDITVNWISAPPIVGATVFEGLTLSAIQLHVPAGTRAAYERAEIWKEFTLVEQSGGGGSCMGGTFGESGALRWELCGGTLTISGAGAMPDDQPWVLYKNDITTVVIEPGITSIGSVFTRCSGLVSITLPETVTSIEDDAFARCGNLASISIPASVKFIGGRAFVACSSLESVHFAPASLLTSIGDLAFSTCEALKSIVLPERVVFIGNRAFVACESLASVTIPASVTFMDYAAFGWCSRLADVTVNWTTRPLSITGEEFVALNLSDINLHVPSNTKAIYEATEVWKEFNIVEHSGGSCPSGTFGEGGALSWELCDGTLTIRGAGRMPDDGSDSQPWFPYRNEITSAVIESGVENVGASAFVDHVHLASVVIPKSVTSIERQAFAGCSSLTDVTVNWNVEADPMVMFPSVSSTAFSGLTLSTITLHVPAGEGAAYEREYPWQAFNIVEHGGSCHSGMFGENNALSWELCDGTLTIRGAGAMPDYESGDTNMPWYLYKEDIAALTVTAGVESIGDWGFESCSNLRSITLSASVTSIGEGAFVDCSGLTSVDIYRVTSIGDWAFAYCSSLTEITVDSNNPVYSSEGGVLFDKSNATLVLYPAGKTGDRYVIPEWVTSIGATAFHCCYNLTSVIVPAAVTVIGDWAFLDCSNLVSVVFAPASMLTVIEDHAFIYCSRLTSIDIPAGVRSIKELAFAVCRALANVTVHWTETLPTMSLDAFHDLTLSEIALHIPAGTRAMYEAAEVWKEFDIVEHTGCHSGTFGENNALTWELCEGTLTIGGTGSIPDYAGISVVSGTGAASNGNADNRPPWYEYREEITTVVIESGITAIGTRTFAGCIHLTDVKVNWTSTPPAIDSNLFEGLDLSHITLHVPDGTESIYENAEVWKEFMIVEQPPVGIKNTAPTNTLKAYVRNGALHMSGLAAGEALNVYGISGTRVYQGVANGDEATVALRGRGVYVVVSGGRSVKVVY